MIAICDIAIFILLVTILSLSEACSSVSRISVSLVYMLMIPFDASSTTAANVTICRLSFVANDFLMELKMRMANFFVLC